MGLWLSRIFAAISLVVCLGLVGLWVRSHGQPPLHDTWMTSGFDEHTVSAHDGRVAWTKMYVARAFRMDELATPPVRDSSGGGLRPLERRRRWTPPGVLWEESWGTEPLKSGPFRYPVFRSVSVHIAWLVAIAGAMPLAWVLRRPARRRRWRLAHGLCGGCGYDLRASAERCPECGAATPVGRGGSLRGCAGTLPVPAGKMGPISGGAPGHRRAEAVTSCPRVFMLAV